MHQYNASFHNAREWQQPHGNNMRMETNVKFGNGSEREWELTRTDSGSVGYGWRVK